MKMKLSQVFFMRLVETGVTQRNQASMTSMSNTISWAWSHKETSIYPLLFLERIQFELCHRSRGRYTLQKNTNLQESFDGTLSKELLGFISNFLLHDFIFFFFLVGIMPWTVFSKQKILLSSCYFENNNTWSRNHVPTKN